MGYGTSGRRGGQVRAGQAIHSNGSHSEASFKCRKLSGDIRASDLASGFSDSPTLRPQLTNFREGGCLRNRPACPGGEECPPSANPETSPHLTSPHPFGNHARGWGAGGRGLGGMSPGSKAKVNSRSRCLRFPRRREIGRSGEMSVPGGLVRDDLIQ